MASEVKALTGLRGAAASIVAVHHFLQMPISPWHELPLRGYLAVDVFFVLSGFVLALTYADAFAVDRGSQPYRDFLIRRVARIYPIFLVILLYTVLRIALQDPSALASSGALRCVVANLLLIQGWGMAPSLIIPSWSISTEMAAYLAFPMILRCTLFCDPRRALGSALAAALLLMVAATLAPVPASPGRGALDIYDGTTPLPLLRCIGGFVLGVLAFRLARHTNGPNDRSIGRHRAAAMSLCSARRRPPTRRASLIAVAGRDGAAALLLGLLVLGLATGVGDLVLYPLFPAIVIACYANRGRLARVLGGGVVYRLGVWSYAIYLLHPDVFRQMAALALHLGFTPAGFAPLTAPTAIACGAIGFAIVLLLAALAHHLIEVPGRRLVRGWHVGVGHLRAGKPSLP